ncbi:MAG: response regulator [Planctomycetota bacterium]|nr:response regulator [Planctomycetota bacterium]
MSTDPTQKLRVLVVDDEPDPRQFIIRVLKSAGCEVRAAADGEQALIEAIDFQAEVVFLDVGIPLQYGWLVCAKLKLVAPSPIVVLMTGLDCDDLSSFSEFVKADDVLRKPFSAEDVLRFVPSVPV